MDIDFGAWNTSIHDEPEQIKRLKTAQKSDTTPISVDIENQTAFFSGSGNIPYAVTLRNCTCGDFIRRKLPCKHIYRLAIELGLIDCNFNFGRNKNCLSHDIFSLPVESQEMLYDACYQSIYRNCPIFVFNRTPLSELLLYKGFFYESIPNISLFELLPISVIKEILFNLEVSELPAPKCQKKTLLHWISEHQEQAFLSIGARYIFLEFTEQTAKDKFSIHRRYAKKFLHESIEVAPGTEIFVDNEIKVFTQE